VRSAPFGRYPINVVVYRQPRRFGPRARRRVGAGEGAETLALEGYEKLLSVRLDDEFVHESREIPMAEMEDA
jgi:hypothetical protein